MLELTDYLIYESSLKRGNETLLAYGLRNNGTNIKELEKLRLILLYLLTNSNVDVKVKRTDKLKAPSNRQVENSMNFARALYRNNYEYFILSEPSRKEAGIKLRELNKMEDVIDYIICDWFNLEDWVVKMKEGR